MNLFFIGSFIENISSGGPHACWDRRRQPLSATSSQSLLWRECCAPRWANIASWGFLYSPSNLHCLNSHLCPARIPPFLLEQACDPKEDYIKDLTDMVETGCAHRCSPAPHIPAKDAADLYNAKHSKHTCSLWKHQICLFLGWSIILKSCNKCSKFKLNNYIVRGKSMFASGPLVTEDLRVAANALCSLLSYITY